MRTKLGLLLVGSVLLAGLAFGQGALVGKPAPKLQTSNWLNSKTLALAKLKGKVVVLDFWAFW